jgi:hypothetical protein
MKGIVRLAAKLYPRSWRARYGEEFDALLTLIFKDEERGNGRVVLDVVTGALLMQAQRGQKVALIGLSVCVATFAASLWADQHLYHTPGTHQIFRMDSTPGAMLEFLVLLILAITGVLTSIRVARAGWVFAGLAASYMAAILLVSLLTPRTIVSIGDSYCWDLWCVGIQSVNSTPRGESMLYTAELFLFADSDSEQRLPPPDGAKQFFYALDEKGRRFPVVPSPASPAADAAIVVKPGESVKFGLSFLAPASAGRLYLTGDPAAPFWVRLYFGSDLNPFHRRTLLRVV